MRNYSMTGIKEGKCSSVSCASATIPMIPRNCKVAKPSKFTEVLQLIRSDVALAFWYCQANITRGLTNIRTGFEGHIKLCTRICNKTEHQTWRNNVWV